jgi:hypothetical protein
MRTETECHKRVVIEEGDSISFAGIGMLNLDNAWYSDYVQDME